MARTKSDYITGVKSAPQPTDASIKRVAFWLVLPAALAVNDLIAITKLNPGVKCIGFEVIAPQLDSNGAPTLAHSIGVENGTQDDLATVWEASLTFGRTANGSVSRSGTAVEALADASSERIVSLKTTTVAATAALAGKTVLVVLDLVA